MLSPPPLRTVFPRSNELVVDCILAFNFDYCHNLFVYILGYILVSYAPGESDASATQVTSCEIHMLHALILSLCATLLVLLMCKKTIGDDCAPCKEAIESRLETVSGLANSKQMTIEVN